MARFKRIDVINKIGETGIIPIFYHNDPVICRNVVKACYEGGIRVIEFTNLGDFAHEVFSDLCKWVENELPDLILGAGSVVDAGIVSRRARIYQSRKGTLSMDEPDAYGRCGTFCLKPEGMVRGWCSMCWHGIQPDNKRDCQEKRLGRVD